MDNFWKFFLLSLICSVIYGFPSSSNNIPTGSNSCGYEGCHPVKDGFINVHIVPHTHDDVGWLKTVDQYYYGSNSNNQKAGVQYILGTVIDSLRKNKDRKFIYVETAFFWKWWIKQSDAIKDEVTEFVNNGQLEFTGGGWSMNDEAATHYHSTIDQMTWGLRKLNDTFGECGRPKIGWQIDPFGHSKEMANIFAQLGFDGFLLGRIDYQDKDFRWSTKTPEFVWRGSTSLGESSDIFTGVLYNTYGPPPEFCFDLLCDDEPFIDDEQSFDYNVDKRVEDFLNYVEGATKVYTTNNILITMGEDFNYQDAESWFINLDKLIYYVNQRQSSGSKYNLLYSTPSCYVKAVHDETQNRTDWLLKEDDFFPYASDKNSYWTGYFTSRPTLKRFERLGNNFLQVCKQLYTLADLGPENINDLDALREAMGIMQHHDAITGTEKQHVADDYARILQKAIERCENITTLALSKLSNTTTTGSAPKISQTNLFKTCPLTNISQCDLTENSEQFVVTLYNPLSRYVEKIIILPVTGMNYNVTDQEGYNYTTQVLPVADFVKNIPGRSSNATYELYFEAKDIPPLGWKSFIVTLDKEAKQIDYPKPKTKEYKLKESGPSYTIDTETGLLTQVKVNNVALELDQDFYYYKGFVGDNGAPERRSSGAYVFRPDGAISNATNGYYRETYLGPVVVEVRRRYNEYINEFVRLNAIGDDLFIEFDWVIGPIPTSVSNGMEIVTRHTINLLSNATFYTDSNGKEMIKRIRDFRPTWNLSNSEPVSSNYYPVTSKILLRDEDQGVELAILTDRAQGGASINDGEIELMIHRNCLHDDSFGVGEALNETAFGKGLVVRGSHYIFLGHYGNGSSFAAAEKDWAQRKLLDAWTFITPLNDITPEEFKSQNIMEYSGLQRALPNNVQILTLEPWKDSSLLLRLEHIFEANEDSVLSKPVVVDLKDLFTAFEIVSLQETTLGANQWLKDNNRLKFKVNGATEDFVSEQISDSDFSSTLNLYREQNIPLEEITHLERNSDDFEITLIPSQIRTFVVEIKRT